MKTIYACECKFRSKFVDVDILQDLTRDIHKLYKADFIIVPIAIALSGFSERAVAFAKGSNMLLFSLSEIMEWALK